MMKSRTQVETAWLTKNPPNSDHLREPKPQHLAFVIRRSQYASRGIQGIQLKRQKTRPQTALMTISQRQRKLLFDLALNIRRY